MEKSMRVYYVCVRHLILRQFSGGLALATHATRIFICCASSIFLSTTSFPSVASMAIVTRPRKADPTSSISFSDLRLKKASEGPPSSFSTSGCNMKSCATLSSPISSSSIRHWSCRCNTLITLPKQCLFSCRRSCQTLPAYLHPYRNSQCM